MIAWQKPLKVGKVERYSLDLTNFANGQTITTITFASEGGLSTVGAPVIDGAIVSALFTGVTAGTDTIAAEYETATRSDCLDIKLIVQDC